MTVILATHLASKGNAERYEEFLQKRKISVIRNLPGVKAYRVFRAEVAMEPEGAPLKYEYSAVIELEEGASLEDMEALNTGADFQEFVKEYEHLLEAETHLYFGHEVKCKASQSKEEFWASR